MRFSRYCLGASYLATHNHSAIPEVTLKSSALVISMADHTQISKRVSSLTKSMENAPVNSTTQLKPHCFDKLTD
jgi:hypothetical protein